MSKCDYRCSRRSSLEIICSIKICLQCSIHVHQLLQHCKQQLLSTFELNVIPLDPNDITEWLCTDEMNLIEGIESCGSGNRIDIGSRPSRNTLDCPTRFEETYLPRSSNPYSIYFQSFTDQKQLIAESQINPKDFFNQSIIYPLLLIDSGQQKTLTYMPQRDEYEREDLNEDENHLPILTNDADFLKNAPQDGSRVLLNKAKFVLLRSYKQTIQGRLQLKEFFGDYALRFNYSIFNHRREWFLPEKSVERLKD